VLALGQTGGARAGLVLALGWAGGAGAGPVVLELGRSLRLQCDWCGASLWWREGQKEEEEEERERVDEKLRKSEGERRRGERNKLKT